MIGKTRVKQTALLRVASGEGDKAAVEQQEAAAQASNRFAMLVFIVLLIIVIIVVMTIVYMQGKNKEKDSEGGDHSSQRKLQVCLTVECGYYGRFYKNQITTDAPPACSDFYGYVCSNSSKKVKGRLRRHMLMETLSIALNDILQGTEAELAAASVYKPTKVMVEQCKELIESSGKTPDMTFLTQTLERSHVLPWILITQKENTLPETLKALMDLIMEADVNVLFKISITFRRGIPVIKLSAPLDISDAKLDHDLDEKLVQFEGSIHNQFSVWLKHLNMPDEYSKLEEDIQTYTYNVFVKWRTAVKVIEPDFQTQYEDMGYKGLTSTSTVPDWQYQIEYGILLYLSLHVILRRLLKLTQATVTPRYAKNLYVAKWVPQTAKVLFQLSPKERSLLVSYLAYRRMAFMFLHRIDLKKDPATCGLIVQRYMPEGLLYKHFQTSQLADKMGPRSTIAKKVVTEIKAALTNVLRDKYELNHISSPMTDLHS